MHAAESQVRVMTGETGKTGSPVLLHGEGDDGRVERDAGKRAARHAPLQGAVTRRHNYNYVCTHTTEGDRRGRKEKISSCLQTGPLSLLVSSFRRAPWTIPQRLNKRNVDFPTFPSPRNSRHTETA